MAALYQNVWSQGDYIYHTTPSGVDVYNSDASALDYHIPLPNAATAVWANDTYIYMGTSSSGVYRSTISGAASPYLKVPDLLSNDTVYLHGAGDYLCVTTVSGVDRHNLTTASGISSYNDDTHKCFQTASGTLYYFDNSSFFDYDESALGGNIRNWQYYQQIPFTATTIPNPQVRVIFNLDFPYHHTKDAGADLRFLDHDGNNLPYYIEAWHPDAIVLVNALQTGTDHFYMLYGNAQATAQSSAVGAYPENNTYTTSEEDLWELIHPKLHVVYAPDSDWVTADYIYEAFYADPLFINDIHITEGTSSYNNNNTILLATTRGAHVIEERQADEENANQKRYYIS